MHGNVHQGDREENQSLEGRGSTGNHDGGLLDLYKASGDGDHVQIPWAGSHSI